jgi:TRAP transporter TAXI family solute receptor
MLVPNRWYLFRIVTAILCIAGVAWLALVYFIPAPPTKITIATSLQGDHYQMLGTRYQGILAGSTIELQLQTTDGAKENLHLLNDPNSGIAAAFMHGGLSNSRLSPDLLSLGRIDYQIFWLFYPTGETVTDLSQLKGKRLALGPTDSGDRAVCEKILAAAGVHYDNTTLLYVPARDAAKALDDGTVDAVFLNLALSSPILQSLLTSPQYRLMSFSEAEALTRIFPYLVRLSLPRGAIDLQRKIPITDVELVATTNVVLVRKDIHPTVIDLLARAILEAHNLPGLFQKLGDFPTQADPEYPIAQSARDFYKNGPSFLNRYLPFWMTSYAQRVIAVLVAAIAIVVPIFNYAPKLYLWFIRERVRRLYRRLRLVDKELTMELCPAELQAVQFELDSIARAASVVPMRNSELFFGLLTHIDRTRAQLRDRGAQTTRHGLISSRAS